MGLGNINLRDQDKVWLIYIRTNFSNLAKIIFLLKMKQKDCLLCCFE